MRICNGFQSWLQEAVFFSCRQTDPYVGLPGMRTTAKDKWICTATLTCWIVQGQQNCAMHGSVCVQSPTFAVHRSVKP